MYGKGSLTFPQACSLRGNQWETIIFTKAKNIGPEDVPSKEKKSIEMQSQAKHLLKKKGKSSLTKISKSIEEDAYFLLEKSCHTASLNALPLFPLFAIISSVASTTLFENLYMCNMIHAIESQHHPIYHQKMHLVHCVDDGKKE